MQRARDLDVLPFRGDDGIDQASDLLVKRRAAQLPAMVLDGGAQPIEIALDHGRDQRLPVGEILIETADRDAGALSNSRGDQFAVPDRQQNLNACVEKRRHGRFRTGLNRPFSGLERMVRLDRHECEFPKHEGSFTLTVVRGEASPVTFRFRSGAAEQTSPRQLDFSPATHEEPCMRSVVVTGTSTGIGWGTTKVLIARGFRVFGSVRKKADAERFSAEFGAALVPLVFDVTDEDAVGSAAVRVGDALAGERLFGLVNNAGVAVAGPLLELPLDEFRHQIDINLTGVVITTKAFGPLLGTDRALTGPPGRIVNISSVGGKNAVPFLSPYAASKFALEGLSEGLRRELLPFGIDVIVVAPGAVATAIWVSGRRCCAR